VRVAGGVLRPDDPHPRVRAELRDWLALQHALALRPERARAALAERCGPAAALRRACLAAPPTARLEADRERLLGCGAVALPFGAPAYPERIARLPDAPPLLLVRGDVGALAGPCVAVVGSRAATAYGREAARRFAAALARAGATVVSGLATGIDAVAHEAALEAGGRTAAVLACGPDVVYPARHRGLAERIAAAGALASEFPPGTRPRPPYFPLRNRLISGLSVAVLVVEARLRSGSLVTAGLAADQGIDVHAVPGPIDVPTSEGTNRLLRDGAFVALSPDELVADLCRSGALPAACAPLPAPAALRPPRAPGAGAARILAALRDQPLTRDELGRRLSAAPEELAPELIELELEGAVGLDRDGRLRVRFRREL
jgi:DNA processing protein